MPAILLILLLLPQLGAAQQAGPDSGPGIDAAQSSRPVPLIDREHFFRPPAISKASLSPDGSVLAYSLREGSRTTLYLKDSATLTLLRRYSTPRLDDFHWAADSSLLYLELTDAAGYLPVDTERPPGFILGGSELESSRLLGPDGSAAGGILVVATNADDEFLLRRHTLDGQSRTLLNTGEQSPTAALLSPDQSLLFVRFETEAGYRFYQYRNGDREHFFSCPVLASPVSCRLLSFDADSGTLWLMGSGSGNFVELLAYTPADGVLRHVHRDPEGIGDLSGVVLHEASPALAQYENGLLLNYGLTPESDKRIRDLQQRFADSNLFPSIGSDGTWLLREAGARLRHPRYWLQYADNAEPVPILETERDTAGELPQALLSRKQPLSYPAGDGMTIHGYLSLPQGMKPDSAPLIALPHGGPRGRVNSEYAADTQFLVNRGYIVFEPNFRISTGYGNDYQRAVDRQRPFQSIQQDIHDGIDFLLARGIGDPERVGIAGFSYGGYAALSGLAFTPGKFRAGLSLAGPADLSVTLGFQLKRPGADRERPMARASMRELMADVDDPAELQRLHEQSPLASLDAVEAPLLLLGGGTDRALPPGMLKNLGLQLLNRSKRFTLFFDENLGHGGWPEFETGAYYALMEAFFALYLGGDRQAVEAPELSRYISDSLLLNTDPDFLQALELQ